MPERPQTDKPREIRAYWGDRAGSLREVLKIGSKNYLTRPPRAAAGRADEKRPTRKARGWLKGAVGPRTPDRQPAVLAPIATMMAPLAGPQRRRRSLPRSGRPSAPRSTPPSRERRQPAWAITRPAGLRGRRCARRSGRTICWSPATWSARSSRSSRAKWPTGSNSNLCTMRKLLGSSKAKIYFGAPVHVCSGCAKQGGAGANSNRSAADCRVRGIRGAGQVGRSARK